MAHELTSAATNPPQPEKSRIWRSVVCIALIASIFVTTTSSSVGAQQGQPTIGDTARLLGHLWADGSYDNGVWDATGPSGGSDLIQRLVNNHGGTWVNRTQLIFTLPAPYDWAEWKGSLPNDDARTREAVQHPNFLAALIEGEGSTAGLIYDQSSCCTAGFTNGRLVELRDMLVDSGYSSTTLTMFGNADSGRVNIATSEFGELRQNLEFICPSTGGSIRVPGAEDFAAYGPIQWLGVNGDYGDVVRTDCVNGQAISQVSAPVGDCVVTSDGNGNLRLTWSFQRGLATIRRNGVFVESVPAMGHVYVDSSAAGQSTYTLRVSSDTLRTDKSCGTSSTTASFTAAPTPGQTCAGKVVTVMGTGGSDSIRGTDGNDVIHGYGGDDEIFAVQGDDIVCGGGGADTVHAGKGNDVVWGGQGFDVLYGAQGNDTLRAVGSTEEDLVGGSRMFGGAGDDKLVGSTRWDRMQGGAGNDWLRGLNGRDWMRGGADNDRLFGDGGIDDLHGGNGRDFIQIQGLDTVRGGAGTDGCLYATPQAEVVFSCETTLTQATATAFIAALIQ